MLTAERKIYKRSNNFLLTEKNYAKKTLSSYPHNLSLSFYLDWFGAFDYWRGPFRFIEMGLKAFVFTEFERQERLMHQMFHAPYSFPMSIVEIGKNQQKIEEEKEICLTETEKEIFDRWSADYRRWEEKRMEIDPVAVRRHQEASSNLAMILIGLPLYLYHWAIIKRETRNKKEEEYQNTEQ